MFHLDVDFRVRIGFIFLMCAIKALTIYYICLDVICRHTGTQAEVGVT